MSDEKFYGHDCPKGMVQVETVGCSPDNMRSAYGWKPEKKAFIDIYVDGKRFHIFVGEFDDGYGEQRGLHIIADEKVAVRETAGNSCSLWIESVPERAKRMEGGDE